MTLALTLTLLLAKLERCQQWFLSNIFYAPKFAPNQLLLKLSGLKSIESEIALRRLLFLGRLLSGDKMASVVGEIFEIRADSYLHSCKQGSPDQYSEVRKVDRVWFSLACLPCKRPE